MNDKAISQCLNDIEFAWKRYYELGTQYVGWPDSTDIITLFDFWRNNDSDYLKSINEDLDIGELKDKPEFWVFFKDDSKVFFVLAKVLNKYLDDIKGMSDEEYNKLCDWLKTKSKKDKYR